MRAVIDPDVVRERWLELQAPGAVVAQRAACEAAAVEERLVPFSWWAYQPRPFPRELAGEDPLSGGSGQQSRLGVDAAGRVVFQRLRDDLFQVYDWSSDHCDMIEVNSSLLRLLRFVFAGGVLMEEIAVEGHDHRLDGRPRVEVTRWCYEEGRPSLVLTTYESGAHPGWGGPERGPYWQARAHRFAYDADGELAVITTYAVAGDLADGGNVEAAQAEARARLPEQSESQLLYDARTQRRETELPDPRHAYDGLGESLAKALLMALQPHLARLGPLDLVIVYPGGKTPELIALGTSFVTRALQTVDRTEDLLVAAYRGAGGAVRVDAVDTAPPEVLRRVRAGRQVHADPTGLERELVAALRARDLPCPVEAWGAGAIADRYTGRFARPPLAGDLRPRDRDELAVLLEGAGLTDAEAASIVADAEWSIQFVPGRAGVSRLGGAPVLATSTPWPHADDRPLTHLATIAMAELPAVEGRDYLPEDGVLSFFADLSEEGELVDAVEPGEGALAAVIHTAPGVPTHEPEPPGERLDELRVESTARLQLRHLSTNYQPRSTRSPRTRWCASPSASTARPRLRCSATPCRSRRIRGSRASASCSTSLSGSGSASRSWMAVTSTTWASPVAGIS